MDYKSKLMGILNITPDSFSDGGKYIDTDSILKHTIKLIQDGAHIIDIGAESTGPNAIPITQEQEWCRLDNVLADIINICKKSAVKVSLDTRHPKSAKMAIDMGIDWINDVDGFKQPQMVSAVKNNDVSLVVMHSLGVPANKNITITEDKDPVSQVKKWAQNQITNLANEGINKDRIIFDPGVGFGKTAAQSFEIINRIDELKSLGVEILVGHSRKSFYGGNLQDRDVKTLTTSKQLAANGVNYLRVHDVYGHAKQLSYL